MQNPLKGAALRPRDASQRRRRRDREALANSDEAIGKSGSLVFLHRCRRGSECAGRAMPRGAIQAFKLVEAAACGSATKNSPALPNANLRAFLTAVAPSATCSGLLAAMSSVSAGRCPRRLSGLVTLFEPHTYHNRCKAELLQNCACLRQATRAVEEVFHASFISLFFRAGFAMRRYCAGTDGRTVFRDSDSDPGWNFD